LDNFLGLNAIVVHPPGKACHQCCGSRIRDWVLVDPGIRDGRKSASGSGIQDEQPGSYFLELRNHFFAFFLGLKYLNSLMRIRDPGWRQFGSGIWDEKKSDPGSAIRDKHPGSATLPANYH
jgi:hypothetical protein